MNQMDWTKSAAPAKLSLFQQDTYDRFVLFDIPESCKTSALFTKTPQASAVLFRYCARLPPATPVFLLIADIKGVIEGGKLLLATDEPIIPLHNDTSLMGMDLPISCDAITGMRWFAFSSKNVRFTRIHEKTDACDGIMCHGGQCM